jgi:hypothetical protein
MGSPERRWYYIDTFVKGNSGPRNRRGPYLGERVPMNGTVEVANKGGDLVTVDERIYLPAVSGLKARAVLVDVASNMTYEVLYIQRWLPRIEAWVKRTMPD